MAEERRKPISAMTKKVLGRGLGALISSGSSPGLDGGIQQIPIDQIVPNPYQPRKSFDKEKLKELVDSIKENGIIQPLVVTKVKEGYQIVVGERRWRAAKEAGLRQVPVIVKDLTPQDRIAMALVENLQRDDLNAIEEAQAFHYLLEGFGFTQEDLSKKVGRSRPYIANTLRLLNLPDPVKSFVVDGKLSPGHARALLGIQNPQEALALAQKIVQSQLSVRQVEDLVKKKEVGKKDVVSVVSSPHPLEKVLAQALRTRVKIHAGKRGGKIEIAFRNQEELDALSRLFSRLAEHGFPDKAILF
jgi:ParB family chromosome partitioning protein